MRLSILFSILLLTTFSLFSQKRKRTNEIPQSTSAKARWEGYQKRLKLEKNSLLKSVEFRNVGPTVMRGRVVDMAVNPDNPPHIYVA